MEEKRLTNEEIVKDIERSTGMPSYWKKIVLDLIRRLQDENEAWRLKSKELEAAWEISSSNEEKLQKQVDEYRDKIEQETLIELPCKVGDTVYAIDTDWDEDCHNFYYVAEIKFSLDIFDCWGDWVFLTREEAEKRLKEVQE